MSEKIVNALQKSEETQNNRRKCDKIIIKQMEKTTKI